jgi:Cd2+/Zn2+-exporting ATPase
MRLVLKGLTCSNCAIKIENEINKSDFVKNAKFNFATQLLTIENVNNLNKNEIINKIRDIVHKYEPHVKVVLEEDIKDQSNKNKLDYNYSLLIRFIISFSLFLMTLLLDISHSIEVILLLISYVIIAYDIILKALRNIRAGQVFDENFLMMIATFGAIFLKEYHEANAVMLFYQFGEYLQSLAVDQSRQSISNLMDIKSTYANLKSNFSTKKVKPESLNINDLIVIKPGEKVPIDGEIVNGEGFIDTIALTGESIPRKLGVGDEILSGFINKDHALTVRVTKLFEDSAVAKILHLVEEASSKKAPTEKFITRFAKYYTPFVVYFAIALTLIPTIIFGQSFNIWFYRSLIFLVVSCPCALVVSIPLGFFSGIGIFSKNGILVKGGNYLEGLTKINNVVFDKTGTLTKGTFEVKKIIPSKGYTKDELLTYAAYGESYSNHPIGQAIVQKYNHSINENILSNFKEHSGKGISLNHNDNRLLIGNHKLMDTFDISHENITTPNTIVYVALDQNYLGYLTLADQIKSDAKESIMALKNKYGKDIFMLTGDNDQIAKDVANELNIDNYFSSLLPNEKVEKLNDIMKKGKTIFVGDGINDAPVLKISDIGIAMGGLGSDAAIEASDIVIMNDELSKIGDSFKLASITKKIVMENIVFALSVKLFVLGLSAFGMTSMKLAVFADVGVALLAILNSIRILGIKIDKKNRN